MQFKSRTQILALIILVSVFAVPPKWTAQAQNTESIKPTITGIPRQTYFKPRPETKEIDRLMLNYSEAKRFREKATQRLYLLKATTIPPPPLSPDLPQIEFGVAFKLKHPMGPRWTTAAQFAHKVDKLEIRDQEGQWHPVEANLNCEQVPLATLTGIPKTIIGSNTKKETSSTSESQAFDIRNPADLAQHLPFVAVVGVGGQFPTLHRGELTEELPTNPDKTWNTTLRLYPGTPLLDASARVVLVQTGRGTLQRATSPQDGFRCPDIPEETDSKSSGASDG